MKNSFLFLTLFAASVLPAGATAFSGSATSAGFSSGGCDAVTMDQSGLSLVDSADGFHLTGTLVVSGAPTEQFGCGGFSMYIARTLAEPGGTDLILSVSQTATMQLTGDWQMQWYSMSAYLEFPCISTPASASALTPSSGALNLGPVNAPMCQSGTVYNPDTLYGNIGFALLVNGEGSMTINYGNSAEFAANPVNPVPEPATALLMAAPIAFALIRGAYWKPSTAQIS